MEDSFKPDFYVAAATVIPVLYLALTLQGSAFEKWMKRWEGGASQYFQSKLTVKSFVRVAGFMVIGVFAAAFVFAGIAGELFSFWALYQEGSSLGMKAFIFLSIVLLLVTVIIGPLMRFLYIIFYPFTSGYIKIPGKHPNSRAQSDTKAEEAPETKAEEAPETKAEEAPETKAEEAPETKAEEAPETKAEEAS